MPRNFEISPKEKGFAHVFVLIVAVIALTGFVGSAHIKTTKEFSTSTASQSVLGDDEEAAKAEEQQKEAQKAQEEVQKKEEEKQKETSSSSGSGSSGTIKTKTESISSTGIKTKTRTEGKKSETEIKTPDGQKIKTKVEDDGTTKVEIENKQLKIKYVVENGQIKLKAENEEGEEVEVEDEARDEAESEIEDELAEEGIKIASGSGKPVFAKNNVAALTDFPLSIEVGTNRLIVNTPAGQKAVTVLPDQAVENLLATGIINRIEQQSDTAITDELGQLSGVVKLEVRNSEVVYKVKGAKIHNLLGFIPVETSTTAFVSVENGQTVAQEQSLLASVVDFLSP